MTEINNDIVEKARGSIAREKMKKKIYHVKIYRFHEVMADNYKRAYEEAKKLCPDEFLF